MVLGFEFGVVAAVLFGLPEGVYLLAAVALSRATQGDLERLLPSDDDVGVSIRMLKPTKKSLLVWFLFALIVNWATVASALTGVFGIGFAEFHRDSGSPNSIENGCWGRQVRPSSGMSQAPPTH